ncbi:hypothetical protein BOTCAL_0395g00110 [Botryotinia calthae]|uniref:Uncharacterized protein n=1 Tax=Botryotinia calthae TaxID=38488 RepID=A0A4Y8CRD0_9HELO|nr:hypothetical protein BOTCAL_0395g00110 [Botryotinia calthae]
MSPLPNIAKITMAIKDATDVTQIELTVMETIIYGFFAPLGIICMIFFITAWIAILIISIYDRMGNWIHDSSVASEKRRASKPTSRHLTPINERANSPLLYVNKWSENWTEGVEFFDRDGLPNYGTITQRPRDEFGDTREGIVVSKEMMRESSGTDQV